MKIELTHEQEQAVLQGHPVEVLDPQTQCAYVLIPREAYEGGRSPLAQPASATAGDEDSYIPPGVRRSQEAFWRDLPQLLSQKKLRGQWVCYHGDERIGIAARDEPLLRECLRRGLRDDAYHLDVIEPQSVPPWEPLDIERGGHELDEVEFVDEPGPAGEPA